MNLSSEGAERLRRPAPRTELLKVLHSYLSRKLEKNAYETNSKQRRVHIDDQRTIVTELLYGTNLENGLP